MNDILMTLLCLGLVIAALVLSVMLYEGKAATPSEIRNGIHMLGGLWGLLWWFFESRWVALAVCIVPLGLITMMVWPPAFLKWPLLEKFNARVRALLTYQEEVMEGILYYALALSLITFALWDNRLIGTAAVLALSFGDGIAGIWGRAYGTRFYQSPWGKKKTIEGSLAGMIAAFLGILFVTVLIRGAMTPAVIILALVGGITAAVAEGVSPRASDNFFVPVSVSLVLIVFHIF